MLEIIIFHSTGKQTQKLWEFVFDIKNGGKYSNNWDLKGFTNILQRKQLDALSL